MLTLKASIQGLEKIHYAREQRNLAIDDPQWLYEASKVLEPNGNWNAEEGRFENGVSDSTFKRFYYGKKIKAPVFKAFCHVLGLNWEEVVEQDKENPVYVERKSIDSPKYIEAQCYEEIQKPGAVIRIKAIKHMGKTRLLQKILDFSGKQQGYHTVMLDFRQADSTIFNNYETLLKWICLWIVEDLDLEENLDKYWYEKSGNNKNCTRYFQKYLLSNIDTPLVIGLDNTDLVFEHPKFFNDFTNLIRSWYNQAKSSDHIAKIWKKIRIVIVHSTEVYRGMDINSSPLWGVGLTVEPQDFQPEEVLSLAQQYGLNWNAFDVKKLMTLIGGNPGLVNIALASTKQQSLSVEELLNSAATESGVFRNHFGRQLHNLRKSPELASAFLLCVSDQEPVDIDSPLAFKLHAMGLVKLRENRVTPSCNLYRQYFSSRLA